MADHVDDLIPSVDLQSADLSSDRVAHLLELFPEASSDGKVDFERLRALLGERVEEGRERFGLFWPGKAEAERLAYQRSVGTLLPCEDRSVSFGASGNVIIEGDNLESLKLMLGSYTGAVKIIYIDPPYNTGKDFVYPDNYFMSESSYYNALDGISTEENKSSNGRYHSKWLSMMLPRMTLARQLLRDDGVIFISIDDHEVANLISLCNYVFGHDCFIGSICHKSRASVSNDKVISKSHDFILIYARSVSVVESRRSEFGLEKDMSGFTKKDETGKYKLVPTDGPGGARKGNPFFEFMGIEGYFRYSKEKMQEMYSMGLLVVSEKRIQKKYYEHEAIGKRQTITSWWDDGFYTSSASIELKKLMGGQVFTNPKHVDLIRRIISLWAHDENDIIMDFFAGSGSTAHAVMAQNADDGVNRRFILVQLPEVIQSDDEITKSGYKTIADITRDRVIRAAKQIRSTDTLNLNPNLDLGFRYFRLAESNFIPYTPTDTSSPELNLQPDNIREGRTDQHIVFQLMLTLKVPLSAKTEEKTLPGGTKSWHIADGELVVITNDLTLQALHALADELKALKTTRDLKGVVILDRCFAANADLKANARKIFEDADIPLKTV